MNRPQSIFAGGAFALLMTSASAFAMPGASLTPRMTAESRAAIILAQAECPEGTECPPATDKPEGDAPAAEQPADKPAEAPAPEPKAEQPAEAPAAEQPADKPAEAPAPEPKAEQPAEAPAAEQPADKPAEAPAPEPKAEQPAEAPAAEQPVDKPAEAPAPEPKAEQPAEAPAAEQPADKPAEAPAPEPKAEQPAEAPAAEQPADKPAEAPTPEPKAEQPAEAPATEQPAVQPKADAQQPAQQGEAPATDGKPARTGQARRRDGGKAPVLDSQKPAAEGAQPTQGQQPVDQQAAPAAPPPTDDKAAQEAAQPKEIVPVTQEKGERRRERPTVEQRERPQGAEVVRKLGDRIILNFDNQTIVESDDRERMGRGARDVYYEDLPRGRTREVIQRENGVQVVTIRNRNGDIIRRSRITPDGREYVLVYVDENNYDNMREWRDPGRDLPPMRLDMPEDEYILDAESVQEPDAYYDFLSEPPVERVERLYSVDEVKRSARIRDKTRRIDLDTITFEFGKAEVPEDQIKRLEGVAQAITKLLEKNPAESFLIEGHTDAVGSDDANLALSDRRAEAVANALTNVFGVPPENLATQGYGEQYLKVRTEEPERLNRRVAIRRITPLVAPVASAQ